MIQDIQTIPLKKVRIDGDTQSRVSVDSDTVNHYAEEMKNGATFPPLQVVFDGKDYWLCDGFHTWHAARQNGQKDCRAEIIEGTLADARWLAAGANKAHDSAGRHRTNKDKRRAVEMALATEAGKKASDRAIAEHVGVHHSFVSRVRESLSLSDSQPEESTDTPQNSSPENEPDETPVVERTGRDGRTINVSKIGKKSKLIPELAARDWSPRFKPELEKLDEAQQNAFLARINEGMNPNQALAEVSGMGEPEANGKPSREPGSDDKGIGGIIKPPKSGTQAFSFNRFAEKLGEAIAEIDKLAHQHGLLNRGIPSSPEHKDVRKRLEAVVKDVEKWHRNLQRQTA